MAAFAELFTLFTVDAIQTAETEARGGLYLVRESLNAIANWNRLVASEQNVGRKVGDGVALTTSRLKQSTWSANNITDKLLF